LLRIERGTNLAKVNYLARFNFVSLTDGAKQYI
jgi:hypothetical protein